MGTESLRVTENELVVFIDETGEETLQDPNFPIFGRGGCAILGSNYEAHLAKPWRQLKREKLGGAKKIFHASEFGQLPPTRIQIQAINRYVKRPFERFFALADVNTILPSGMDLHQGVSLALLLRIKKIAKRYEAKKLVLIFEQSERGNLLVERDFPLDGLDIRNALNQLVEVEGCFMDKKSMEPGLEIADLIIHTAGRQARYKLEGGLFKKLNPDFNETFRRINLRSTGLFVGEIKQDSYNTKSLENK